MFEHPEIRTLPRTSRETDGPGDACLAVDALLEPYVDGDLDGATCRRVDRHLAVCNACADQLHLARRVRTTLRALPLHVCPETVASAPPAGRLERIRTVLASWSAWSSPPVWAATAAVAVIAAAFGIGYLERPPSLLTPSLIDSAAAPGTARLGGETELQVAQAEAEVKLALAYLGRIGARTGNIVAQDVLEARVAVPIARSVRHALRPVALAPESADEVIR